MNLYAILRPILFTLPPETAHRLSLSFLRLASFLPPLRALMERSFAAPSRPVRLFGLTFPNVLGLAAGYDKDAVAVSGLAALGFGHIEIGTVTLRPQAGNPPPRLFRLVEDQALINRLGFPSQGASRVAQRLIRLRRHRHNLPILGVNLGKNRTTPLEEAFQDYRALMHLFSPLADYLVINISSPNTEGLRRLQQAKKLHDLLGGLQKERQGIPKAPPLLVKLSPDLEQHELEEAIEVILDTGIEGVILTNTTLARPGLRSRHAAEQGGLSGAPLAERSRKMLSLVARKAGQRLGIISVGGIMSAAEAQRRLELGADLVQIYTGLIYQGPALIAEILRAVANS
uniref:Dihydroorotate dehydrogenase (quinone) n=1 Tax=uncultured Chloroflexota bacterium TaxID=166587 RepID=H5SMW3_9CHLR|nr:dihydroorotate oxidase [uncultured Chloroflexota bacterium]